MTFLQFQVKDIIRRTSDDASLSIGLHSLSDLQCIPRKLVLNGFKCNVPSQNFQGSLSIKFEVNILTSS